MFLRRPQNCPKLFRFELLGVLCFHCHVLRILLSNSDIGGSFIIVHPKLILNECLKVRRINFEKVVDQTVFDKELEHCSVEQFEAVVWSLVFGLVVWNALRWDELQNLILESGELRGC